MGRKLRSCFTPVLVLLLIAVSGTCSSGQSTSAPFAFRAGQSIYIVAFRRERQSVIADPVRVAVTPPDYIDLELDAEKRIRQRIEEWRFFKVADKPSDADFVFLVNLDDTSIEGLAVPFDAYRRHFKDKFDLDALRDSAFGRFLAGPLKLATIARLSDRLVKQFREKLDKRVQ